MESETEDGGYRPLRDKDLTVLLAMMVFLGLYAASLRNFLFFHVTAELFSIVIAAGAFMFVWNSRRFLDNNYLLLVGVGFLFIAGIDLIHTLAYRGMDIIGEGSNTATQLWLAARYMQALTFLAAPLLLSRKLNPYHIAAGYALATAFLLASIMVWDVFPTAYVEGVGLTAFKVYSEYFIIVLLGAAAYLLHRRRNRFNPGVHHPLLYSIYATMLSELAFTFYVDVYGFSNFIGHVLKIIAFYLVYTAVIETGLLKPYSILFREIKNREEELERSEERYRSVVQTQTELIAREKPDGTIVYANPAYCRFFGKSLDKLEGTSTYDHIPEKDWEIVKNTYESLKRGEEVVVENRDVRADGEVRWLQWKDAGVFNEQGELIEVQAVGRDITDRRRAEEAVQRERDKLLNFLESMEDGVYIVGADHQVEYVNPVIKEEFGVVEGRNCFEYFSGLDEPCPWCSLGRVLKGETCRTVWTSPRNARTYDIIDTPVHNPDGSVSKLKIMRDITEQSIIQEELRKSEQRYRFLYNESPSLNVVLDTDGVIRNVNQTVLAELGYGRGEVAGKHMRDFIAEEQQKDVDAAIRKLVSGESTGDMEVAVRAKDGGEHIILFSPGKAGAYEHGNFSGILLTGVDITEQKRVEDALRQSEGMYRSLVDASPDAVLLGDIDGNLTYASPRALKMFGYGELAGKNISELVAKGGRNRIKSDMERMKASHVLRRIEYTMVRGDDTTFVGELSSAVIKDANRQPKWFITIVRDVTERRELEDLRSRLLRDLAHQLKTPLSVIEMASDVLKKDMEDYDEAETESLDMISRNTVEMRDLVSKILKLSSLESGRIKVNREKFDLVEAVKEVTVDMRLLADEKKLKLKVKTPTHLTAYSDPKKIEDAVGNLVENAIKYTDNGTVTVTVEKDNGDAVVTVKDTGIGLTRQDLKQVFTRFYKADASVPGTGLGLNIVAEDMRLLGGSVEAESRGPGEGSVFKIRFPIAKAK